MAGLSLPQSRPSSATISAGAGAAVVVSDDRNHVGYAHGRPWHAASDIWCSLRSLPWHHAAQAIGCTTGGRHVLAPGELSLLGSLDRRLCCVYEHLPGRLRRHHQLEPVSHQRSNPHESTPTIGADASGWRLSCAVRAGTLHRALARARPHRPSHLRRYHQLELGKPSKIDRYTDERTRTIGADASGSTLVCCVQRRSAASR